MNKTKTFFTIILLILVSGCSNPLNKKYNDKTLEEDAKAIKESKQLADSDVQLLAAYIVNSKLSGDNINNMTYNEILTKAKAMQAEQKELAEKATKEEEEKRQRLGTAINVALFDIGYYKEDYEDYIYYKMAFENKSGKDIKAVKGTLQITDLFGTEIKTLNIVFDDGVKANEINKTTYTTDYNQFMDDDKSLRSKTINEIKTIWTPEKIIFADGTTLE